MADLLFDGLTTVGPAANTASPAIAQSWSPSPDLKVWTFKLRPDAKFSNGRAITASDAKFSLERVISQGTSVVSSRLEHVSTIKVVDPHTLEVDLDTPLAVLPEMLAAPEFGIVAPESIDAAHPALVNPPVGSGPFAFAKQNGNVIELDRAPGATAHLNQIDVTEYDPAGLGAATDDFAAGKLDFALVSSDRAQLAAQRFGTAGFQPFDAELFYAFNLLDPTFADVRFREAIVKSVDRAALVKAVYPSSADVLTGVVPEGVAGHVADPCGAACAYDPAGAKALLAQAFPNGSVPTVNLDYFTGDNEEAVVDAIAADLGAVGIPTNKRPLPPDQYDPFVVSGQEALFRLGTLGVYPSPDAYLAPLFTTGSHDNTTGFSDPAVDELIGSARSTADPATRLGLYQQAEAAVMQQVPILPIAQFLTKSVVSPRVHDLVLGIDGTFDGTKVWVG